MIESLSQLWDSLFSTSGALIPRLIGAIIILIIGWMIASFLRRLVKRLITRSGIDAKLGNNNREFSFATLISKLVYYLAMIYVLILVLSKAGITSALEPIQNMLNEFLTYLPNIIGAGLIAFAGYMLAKIASEAVALISPALDKISDRVGLSGALRLSALVKQIVFLFIFVPLLLQALNYLEMDLISVPATNMLSDMMSAIPKILAAALILAVFYIVGRYVIAIIVELLKNIGTDDLSQRVGISSFIGENRSLSAVLGNVAFFFLMFAGVMTAVEQLDFDHLSLILRDLFELSGQIFFGLVILLAGNQISEMASNYVAKSESTALASVVRVATLGLFIAISLRSMGIANDIVNMAFMMILGAVSVAIALSYGLGGREAAGEHFKDIINRLRK